MEQYRQYSESNARKVKFENLKMSPLKCGLILMAMSALMAMVKPTGARFFHESHRNGLEPIKYSTLKYSIPHRHFRHNIRKQTYSSYYYHRPTYSKTYHKKKPRTYPALDKVDHRLDNRADYLYDKKLKITTSNPFDDWDDLITQNSTLFHLTYKENDGRTTVHSLDRQQKSRDWEFDFSADSRGYMQDFTTSKPWESTRQDTTFEESAKTNSTEGPETTTTTTTTTSRATANASDDKKKKPTARIYGPRDAAFEHLEQIHREGECRTPKARVVRVHEVHPDPSKSYSPPCTILHQCSADTGCCQNIKDVCKPKNSTKVELYFFTTVMGQPHKVEKLHFENHTECECRSRTEDLMPRDSPEPNLIDGNNILITAMESKSVRNCTCPSRYSPRYMGDGKCICDCFDKQSDCLVLKKGKVNFPYSDRLCIQQSVCRFPSCEFGSYIFSYGRCPKRNEKHHFNRHSAFFSKERIT